MSKFPNTLVTQTLEEGFTLAVKLSRLGVKTAQPDMDTLKRLRTDYAQDANSLIAVSQVVAIHFQTISAVNHGWLQQD